MSEFNGPKVCQHCGYYAQAAPPHGQSRLARRRVGRVPKSRSHKDCVIAPENETCADFTPNPRRWPNTDYPDNNSR